jgi:hypothetical protein
MEITKKNNKEINSIYFCVMFFGDLHVARLYIFLCYVFWWCSCCSSLYISVLCFLVMSSMLLIFIYFYAMFFGDLHVDHLYIFLCYVFWWCPCCSSLYISIDVSFYCSWRSPKNIAHKYIKTSNMNITKKHNIEIYKDEQHGHHQKT